MKITYCLHSDADWRIRVEKCFEHAKTNKLVFLEPSAYLNAPTSYNCALMTFDDGRESIFQEIAPYLRAKCIKSIAFPIMMDWNACNIIVDWNFWNGFQDVFELGAHSMTHTKVMTCREPVEIRRNERGLKQGACEGGGYKRGLVAKEWNCLRGRLETEQEFDQRVMFELVGSKQLIERHTGRLCRYFAYPWGEVDQQLMKKVKDCGYEAAFGIQGEVGNLFNLPRMNVK